MRNEEHIKEKLEKLEKHLTTLELVKDEQLEKSIKRQIEILEWVLDED